jgi:hypothetical protein
MRQKKQWLERTRPDIACSTEKLSQVTESIFNKERQDCVKQLNKIVSHVHKNADVVLRYPKLDKESLRLRVYADASFASNRDETSQLGFLTFLADKHDQCQQMAWASYKLKRVTRSVLGAETMALADAFYAAYSLKHDMQGISQKEAPITLYTDNTVHRLAVPIRRYYQIIYAKGEAAGHRHRGNERCIQKERG